LEAGTVTDTPGPTARPSRLVAAAALFAVLAVGIGLGIVLDRYWVRPSAGGADAKPSSDPRLLGRWVRDDDKVPVEFKSDGTVEYRRVVTFDVPVLGTRPDDIKTEKRTREDTITGQYRWIDAETIEVSEPDFPGLWFASRVVIEGDRLTLLAKDGGVRRHTRAR
jgi:hypothetical protein